MKFQIGDQVLVCNILSFGLGTVIAYSANPFAEFPYVVEYYDINLKQKRTTFFNEMNISPSEDPNDLIKDIL